jgi:hypothetical protein
MRALTVAFIACVLAASAQGEYGGGSGTKDDPYQIWTAQQLNAIGMERADWNKHFKLMADIDMADLGSVPFNVIGIRPIYGRPFSGVFDGNAKMIVNFTCVKSGAMSLGLFGGVQGANALIKDVILKKVHVDGGAGGFVGALVGDLQGGKISRCYVDGGTVSGRSFVGGLVGSCNGTIVNCSSSADVSASSSSAGGLVGRVEGGGAITKSYAATRVSAGSRAGGLAAENAGTISDCYSVSETLATSDTAGGLVGSNGGTIRNAFSAGLVLAPVSAGGLVAAVTGSRHRPEHRADADSRDICRVGHCRHVDDPGGSWISDPEVGGQSFPDVGADDHREDVGRLSVCSDPIRAGSSVDCACEGPGRAGHG